MTMRPRSVVLVIGSPKVVRMRPPLPREPKHPAGWPLRQQIPVKQREALRQRAREAIRAQRRAKSDVPIVFAD